MYTVHYTVITRALSNITKLHYDSHGVLKKYINSELQVQCTLAPLLCNQSTITVIALGPTLLLLFISNQKK